MMSEVLYQTIYDEVAPFLPEMWERLVIYIEYGVASYSMSFYVINGTETVKCFDLPGIDESNLLSAFSRIDSMVAKERDKEKSKWTNMTMIVQGESFKVDFDYTDLSREAYSYRKSWKRKYLEEHS